MLKRLTERLVFHKDKLDPETYMQGRYFIWSFTVLFLLCFSIVPFYLIDHTQFDKNPDAFYANVTFVFVIAIVIWCYSKWGGRVVWVNLLCFMGIGGMYGAYDKTGGIWSSDNVWGIVTAAWAFLLAGRMTGIIWSAFAIGSMIFLYFADVQAWKDFAHDAIEMTSAYPAFNFSLAAVCLLALIWLYESSKKIFVSQLRESKVEVERQKKELELQKEDIIASINYARKIQQAVLPHEEIVTRSIPLSFFLYNPRDIVSGDFYWFHDIDRDNYILAVADCTGHGVPGAFMTVIGSNLLTQIVKDNKVTSPAEILNQLDTRINETLKQDHARYSEVQDGMDLSIVRVNKVKKEFIYTSAKRTAFLVQNNAITELKGSKFSIGGMRSGVKTFDEITVQYQTDDLLYMFTDGYIDQFGGPDNKKYMIRRFREQILGINKLPMPDQKKKLDDTIKAWIGSNEQTDDILVAGIRF